MCDHCKKACELSGRMMMCRPCWRKAYRNRKPTRKGSQKRTDGAN